MSDPVWPHRRQPIRLPRPWDSPGKNTGVGCHFLLQCMKVKSESEVAQSCPTLCDPTDYTVHGIFQARILEWVASPFSRGSSQCRDWTQVSCIACGFFTSWATREALPSIIAVTRSYNFMLPCELPWLISFSLTTASLSWEHLQCLVFPSVKSQDLPDGWLRWDYGKLFLRT